MKPTKKYRKIKKYKSKKHKRKFIGGRDKDPTEPINGTIYARPDMKSFKKLDPSIIDADRKVSCDGVKDQTSLLNKLQGYQYFKLNKPMTLVLFPYCNEEIKQRQLVPSSVADAVDLVNRPLLDAESMNAFITAFSDDSDDKKNKFKFEYKSLTPPLTIELDKQSNTKYIASPPTNAPEFIDILRKYIAQNLDRKKGIFIVSHSGFMTNLMIELLKMEQGEFGAPNLHTDQYEGQPNIAFDNLDMIHIQYDTENQLFLNVTIRRRLYNYNIDSDHKLTDAKEPTEDDVIEQKITSENECTILNIFIMRHCLACHNLSSKISEKAIQYFANRKGYLNYSLCLKKTCADLLHAKNHLLKLFKTYCFFNKSPDFTEIIFGSSVIFRAILTCSLVFNCLTNERLLVKKESFYPRKHMRRGSSKLQLIEEARAFEALQQQLEESSPTYEPQPISRITPPPPTREPPPLPSTPPPPTREPPSLPTKPSSQRSLTLSKREIPFERKPSKRASNPTGKTKAVQVLPRPTNSSTSPRTLRLAMGQEGPRMTAVQRDLPHNPLPVEGGVGEYEGDSGAGIGVPPSKKSLSKSVSQRLEDLSRSPSPSRSSSSSSSPDFDEDEKLLAARLEQLKKSNSSNDSSKTPKTDKEKQAEIEDILDQLPRNSRDSSSSQRSYRPEGYSDMLRTGGSKRRKKKPRRKTHKKKQKKTKKYKKK